MKKLNTQKKRERVAYHEAGHAVVARILWRRGFLRRHDAYR